MAKIYISGLQKQRWSLEFVVSFSIIYIWDLVWKFGFYLLGSCNPHLVYSDKFSGFMFPAMKVKISFGNIYSLNSNFDFCGTDIYVCRIPIRHFFS
jgi:hypothetical protein